MKQWNALHPQAQSLFRALANFDEKADAELLRLEGEVNVARERWRELSGVWNDIEGKVFAACPPWPENNLSSMPADVRDAFKRITVGELETIQRVAPDHSYSVWMREHGDAREAAFQRCHAERELIGEEFGEPEANEAQRAQFDRVQELADELLSIRAASLTGILVKLRLRGWMDYPEGSEAILNSLEDNLRAMAGEPPREVVADEDDDAAEGDADA